MTTVDDEAQARLKARYPKRSPIDYVVFGAGLLAILTAIGLVLAAGLIQANPPVVGMVRTFDVVSPTEATAELVIQRRNPADAVECRVFAQAVSYEKVAEDVIQIPPGTDALTSVPITLKTVKEATTVSLEGCRLAARP